MTGGSKLYNIKGHHHISMLTKDINENNFFYKTILGLRRVKMTVNQDDPSMYHLFYGDNTGSPGTELTFFEMPYVGQTHRGTNAFTRIGLVVTSTASLSYWKERLTQYDISYEEVDRYADRPALFFEDRDGLRLAIQVEPGADAPLFQVWDESPVPAEHQIIGMGTIEVKVRRLQKFARTLTEIFHYSAVKQSNGKIVFQSIKGDIFGEILAIEQDGPREKPGRGSVHHLAIRAKNEAELQHWEEQVRQRGFQTTGILDRFYFKSFYFRESNGVMFEIATDGPGFTIDSDVQSLGEQLDLPPFLEARREEIEAVLKPLKEDK